MPGCEGVPTCILGISKYLCAAYRELPPQRGWLICHDTPRLPGCISHNVPSHVCRATALLLLERGFPLKPRSLLPALPPSATPALRLSARRVSWAFCRLPALTSLEILFATYILVQVHIFAKAYRCLPTRSPQACHGLRSPVPLNPKSAAGTAVGELSVQSLRVPLLRVLFHTITELMVRVGLVKPAK